MTDNHLHATYHRLRAEYGQCDPRTEAAHKALVWAESYGVPGAAEAWLARVLPAAEKVIRLVRSI